MIDSDLNGLLIISEGCLLCCEVVLHPNVKFGSEKTREKVDSQQEIAKGIRLSLLLSLSRLSSEIMDFHRLRFFCLSNISVIWV
jgi:hypothetical protein